MNNTVVINGVVLTRQQVEQALVELNNAPPPYIPQPGDVFSARWTHKDDLHKTWTGHKFIAVHANAVHRESRDDRYILALELGTPHEGIDRAFNPDIFTFEKAPF